MKHVTDRLAAYLADEIPAAERTAVTEHLAGCPACADELASLRRTWEAVDAARFAVDRIPGVWEAVRTRTLAEPSWFFGARPWTRRGWAAAAVAAGLTGGVLLPTLVTPGAAEADPADPVLAGSSWNGNEGADLAGWWLAGAGDGEEDR